MVADVQPSTEEFWPQPRVRRSASAACATQLSARVVRRSETMEWFVLTIGVIAAFGAWCILRVRREYLQQDHLSPPSIVGVWVLYVSH